MSDARYRDSLNTEKYWPTNSGVVVPKPPHFFLKGILLLPQFSVKGNLLLPQSHTGLETRATKPSDKNLLFY